MSPSVPCPSDKINGEMTEWLKVRAWKVRMLQKGIVGSNPAFSAGMALSLFESAIPKSCGSESGIRKESASKRPT